MDLTKEKYGFHFSQISLVVESKCWSQITWVWVLFTEVPKQCKSGIYYFIVGLGVSRSNAVFPGKGKIDSGTKIEVTLEPGKCKDWKLGGKKIVTWPIPAHPSNLNCWHVTSKKPFWSFRPSLATFSFPQQLMLLLKSLPCVFLVSPIDFQL